MALDASVVATRRALLAGSLGALVSYVAQALGRPLPARAVNGDPITAGNTFTASASTGVTTSSGNGLQGICTDVVNAGVFGRNLSDGTQGKGVYGDTNVGTGVLGYSNSSGIGVWGESNTGVGVDGMSQSNIAVRGASGSHIGVRGSSFATDQPAILGLSSGNSTGTLGFSGAGTPPNALTKTGVYGYAAQDGTSVGVSGQSVDGTGVIGTSTSGIAVIGQSQSGYGLRGMSNSTSGVYGTSNSEFGVRGDSESSTGVYGLNAGSSSGFGVVGSSFSNVGVRGESTSGLGVIGSSFSSVGVHGESTSNVGVQGASAASNKPATLGRSTGNSTGVLGFSGIGAVPASPAKTGVYGNAIQDANARGVTGQSTAGQGVRGQATTGTGVYAIATTGTALRAEGAVRFKSSGLATIAMGSRSVIVTPAGLDVTTSSKILALLQGDAGGSTTVQRVAVNATANTFTIYLTVNAVRAVKVSWFVIS